MYRATIVPDDQPAAARTEISELPERSACTAQPRRQACAEGACSRCNTKRTAFGVMPNNEPYVRLPKCFLTACRAAVDSGTTRGRPVLDVQITKHPSAEFTSSAFSFVSSLRRNPHDHNTSITARSRKVETFLRASR